jgi:hypothetical protein
MMKRVPLGNLKNLRSGVLGPVSTIFFSFHFWTLVVPVKGPTPNPCPYTTAHYRICCLDFFRTKFRLTYINILRCQFAIDKARQSIRFQLKKQGSRPYIPTTTSVGQEVSNHRIPNTMQNEICSTQINIQNPEQHVLDAVDHFPQIINGGLSSWLLYNAIRAPNMTTRQNTMIHGIIDPYMASSGGGGSISTAVAVQDAVKIFRTNRQTVDSLCQAKALDEMRDVERQRRMNVIRMDSSLQVLLEGEGIMPILPCWNE